MWPKYLDMEINASKPTLTLPDVDDIIDRRKTPRFHAMVPRDLSDAELRAVQSWYEVAKQNVEEKLGPALAAAQANIMGHASANHEVDVRLHRETQAIVNNAARRIEAMQKG